AAISRLLRRLPPRVSAREPPTVRFALGARTWSGQAGGRRAHGAGNGVPFCWQAVPAGDSAGLQVAEFVVPPVAVAALRRMHEDSHGNPSYAGQTDTKGAKRLHDRLGVLLLVAGRG